VKPVITPPPEAVQELVDERTQHSKTFEMPNNERKLIASLRRVHVPEGKEWVDVDTDFELTGDQYTVKNALYTCTVDRDRIAYTYTSKVKGVVEIELMKIGNQPVKSLTLNFAPEVTDNRILFPSLLPDLDLEFVALAEGLYVNKILHSAAAPRDFTWWIEQDQDCPLRVNMQTQGHDNDGLVAQDRQGQKKGNVCRKLEMVHDVQDVTKKKLDSACEFGETWTGRTYKRDDENRLVLDDECEYPVWIDQDITQPVTADADDGYSVSNGGFINSFANNYGGYFSSGAYYPFARFLALNIPQGSSITLADYIINITSVPVAPNTMDIYAYDVDNAAQFAIGGPRPETSPKTTAKTVAALDSAGLKTYNVTALLQEIVDRPGWVALNNVAFFMLNPVSTGGSYGAYIEDYSNAGTNEPVLEVTFLPPAITQQVVIDYGARTRRVQWTGLAAGNVGDPVIVSEGGDMSVQVTGTFDGATVEFQGSNDGVMYHVLKDDQGNPTSVTAAGLFTVLPRCWMVKPCVVGGGTVDVTITAVLGS